MKRTILSSLVLGPALLLAALLIPAAAAAAGPITSTACAGTGPVTCNLWAKTGTLTLPGPTTVPIWGFSATSGDAATVPGPALVVNQGDTVNVVLHNGLSEATSLLFDGIAMPPDLTGVGPGGSTTYTLPATTSPGTYLYEAGLLDNAQHQVAMGLYGVLIVRSATAGQAYGDPASAYTDEATVVLSEIDPALNTNPAGPAAFDLRDYAPKYFLVNGKVSPDTVPIDASAGSNVLLRYANAGLQSHSMGILGASQTVVATDASFLAHSHRVTNETVAPGETVDAIVAVPASAPAGAKYPIYDAAFNFNNGSSGGLGGMLTYISLAGALPGGTGPTTSGLALAPNPTNGSVPVALTGSVSDVATGNQNVTAAEYFVDSIGANGAGTAMGGTFGTPTAPVSATLSTALLGTLASGNHTIYVHGQDSLGNWGATSSVVLNLDKAGPSTTGPTLTPNPANGTANVALSATADDSATGGSNIHEARYFIDTTAGTGATMTLNKPVDSAPLVGLTATITAATVNALTEGNHTVFVRSQDTLLNWGAFSTITLKVDKTGPATSAVTAAPNPNNGTLGINSSTPAVRVTATFTDAISNVAAGEGFIDTVGATGTGFVFVATDGVFSSPTETGRSDVPLTVINALTPGNHLIYVHGKDAAGNWGATSTTTLLIDKTAPTFTSVTLSPTTANVGQAVTLSATGAVDPPVGGLASGLSGGQYWIDGTATPPANATAFAGTGTSFSAPSGGVHTVYVRVKDTAGNWSIVRSATLTVPSAVADTLTLTANNNATQTSTQAAPGVLANDLPVGAAGRTATLVSGPVRISGAGAGTISVTCGAGPATGVCANGSYTVTLTGVGGTGPARAASKRGTYRFTYTETLNGVTTPAATVTITVN